MEFCFHLSFILSIEAILVQSWMPVKNILNLEQQPHHVPFKNDPFYNYKRSKFQQHNNPFIRRLDHKPNRCPIFSPRDNFLIIGHAGGDPINYCENTLAATRSALKQGANAIEVDVAISKDNVVFLWHDPHPLGLHSLARRLGFTISGKCRPSMSINLPASELKWHEIRKYWYYDDLSHRGFRSPDEIPTLNEWIEEFAQDPRLQLIWLDVKILEERDLMRFVKVMHSLILEHQIPLEKIQFSTHQEAMGKVLQKELFRQGLTDLTSHVVVDTVPMTSYIGHVSAYNAMSKVMPSSSRDLHQCGCCANIGKPIMAPNRLHGLQRLVNFNIAQRNTLTEDTGTYISVFVWTIDEADQMAWLLQSGVDGIITNRPGLLLEQRVRYLRNRISYPRKMI